MSDSRTASRKARAFRSLAIAFIATLVAATSHMLAGGNTPSPLAFVLTIAISLPLVLALSGPRAGRLQLFTAVFGAQGLFHFIFVYAGRPSPVPKSGEVALPAHAEHMRALSGFVPTENLVANPAFDLVMWLAHAVAALFTVALIRRGDSAIAALLNSFGRLVRFPFSQLPQTFPLPKRCISCSFFEHGTFRNLFIRYAIALRGPPALALF